MRMFALIWVTLLFAVSSNKANAATPAAAEITVEAGLCVLMPCSLNTDPGFTLDRAVLYKCDQSKRSCHVSDSVLYLNNSDLYVQSGSRRRVLLSQNNCSIIINDLAETDSGLYQLRVNASLENTTKGYTSADTWITVRGLTQKPTVEVPPLTEGQQTTLTCTAPGLCSGSVPTITWTWRGAGERDSHITGSITEFKTENLTAVTQRHSSALTFNPSAEHHGTKITCKVEYTNDIHTEETVTLNVTYVKEVQITGNTYVKPGETLNLTCSVESFPPSVITWTEHGRNKILNSDTGTASLLISNMTSEARRFICGAKHVSKTLTQQANVTLMNVKRPEIAGKITVKEGDALNLTCSVDLPSLVMWTKIPSSKNLQPHQGNNTGSASLIIHNVTADHTGQYICTAKHLATTLTASTHVTVACPPTILKSSGCRKQSQVLTCECISQGVPLPTVRWAPLENQTEYVLISSVSNHTVNSTFTLTVRDDSSSVAQCVSSNENGEVTENLIIVVAEDNVDPYKTVFKMVTQLEIIIAFLIGAFLSAIICCLVRKCHSLVRKEERIYGNLAETLEMVTSHEDSLMQAGEAVEDYQAIDQGAAAAGGAGAAGKPDVEYSKIDFSMIKRKAPTEAGTPQASTETEYAEIKELKKIEEEAEESGDGAGEGEEEMRGEDTELKHGEPDEKEGEDVALYSNMKDIMNEGELVP